MLIKWIEKSHRLRRFNLPHDDLITIFTGFVRPLAEYVAPVWHCGLTVNESIALEMNLSPWKGSSWAGITLLTMKPFKIVAWILWVTEGINLVWISWSLSWSLTSLVVGSHPREVQCTVEIWGHICLNILDRRTFTGRPHCSPLRFWLVKNTLWAR